MHERPRWPWRLTAGAAAWLVALDTAPAVVAVRQTLRHEDHVGLKDLHPFLTGLWISVAATVLFGIALGCADRWFVALPAAVVGTIFLVVPLALLLLVGRPRTPGDLGAVVAAAGGVAVLVFLIALALLVSGAGLARIGQVLRFRWQPPDRAEPSAPVT